ncbi:hypothetical protein HYN56_10065 [Flavobacterium crocinum]|uniref:Protein kinase domain-containing protein n=1 Tax=Flavobacterium crocinum TaxID=2183896 RepID=A0A2S1YKF8_9FLAO|nr:protein kinase [Flavobacterium crocinum]AWK04555.1 hypothetical protein HYN56_10065 [Flavobacterium crocinum]
MIREILEEYITGNIVEEKSGASGTVFIVEHDAHTTPRRVAYKTIKVNKLNTDQEKYFIDECELWFSRQNSYLVKAFYPLIIKDIPFICMPYFKKDLKTLMLERSFSYIEALVISCKITKSLVEMQKSGIKYHQDFNPPNILIEDLQDKYPNYQSLNALNLVPKISDLGIADLIERIGPTYGGGGGKFPFKAPEQYDRKKYLGYNPDVFALATMIYMLFTNKHPNDLSKERALNKNTSSSYFSNWAFSAKISFTNKNLELILNKCLKEDPTERASAIDLYDALIAELEKIDSVTADKLKFNFEYFDKSNSADLLIQEIESLKNILKLPSRKNQIYINILKKIEYLKTNIVNELDVISLCEYYKLSAINFDENIHRKENILENTLDITNILFKWHSKIRVHHRYSEIKMGDKIIQKLPNFRDIEIVSTYFEVIYKVLLKEQNEKYIEDLFKKFNNDIFYSIYLYTKASLKKNYSNELSGAIELLEKATQLNPTEPLFNYMIYYWILTDYNQMKNQNVDLENKKQIAFKYLKENSKNWEILKSFNPD